MDVNYTYCGDHFPVYTNNESLCCAPETNVICHLYLNFQNIVKKNHLELLCGEWLDVGDEGEETVLVEPAFDLNSWAVRCERVIEL